MKAVLAQPSVAVRALGKSFQGAAGRYRVLDGVSLSIAAGEFVSLLGPSGGGKSTLLNIIAGLEPADTGEVRIALHGAGTGSAAWPNGVVGPGSRPPIAYMQQKDLLLPWRTLLDNVLLAPELRSSVERRGREHEARDLLRAFRLEAFADAYPAQLSGGMRQRAALVRTLLCDQPILLLDEPFGALDAMTRARLQALLLGVWRDYGKTVLLVTHDVEEALLLSDRVLVFSALPGRVLAEFGVPLPREARAASPELLRLRRRVLASLEAHDRA